MGVLAITRKQQPVVYAGNGATQIIQLNKSLGYREIYLRLTGGLTCTAANNTVAATQRGDEWGCIKRIRVVANSSDVLFDLTGDQLWWLNRQFFGNNPRITPALGDGATANPTFDSTLVLPFWATRARKPIDSLFDSGGLIDFRIEITYGTFTDVNNLATAFAQNPLVQVASHEQQISPQFYPQLVKRLVSQVQQPAGASTNFRFPLDIGPMYKGFTINAQTAGGVDAAGLFTNVKLVSGSTTFFDLDEPTLQQAMTLRSDTPFNIEKQTTGIGYQTNPRISSASSLLGWYDLNLVTDGSLTECINTGNFNEFYLEFAVPAACTLNVISHQYLINPRHPAAVA